MHTASFVGELCFVVNCIHVGDWHVLPWLQYTRFYDVQSIEL